MTSAAVSAVADLEPPPQPAAAASPCPAPVDRLAALGSPRPGGTESPRALPPQSPTPSAAASSARSSAVPASHANSRPMALPNQSPAPPPALPDAGGALPSGPPATDSASAPPPPAIASPGNHSSSLAEAGEYRELLDVVSKVSPSVVRQVVRDLWEKCLMGSEFHLTFIMATTLSRASSPALLEAVRTSGDKLVQASGKHILTCLKTQDFDDLADVILAKVSDNFLDQGMARRLETIRARPLVNALARAERLGYDVGDIVEEKSANGGELVVPSPGPLALTSLPSQPLPAPGSLPAMPLPSQTQHLTTGLSRPFQQAHGMVYPPPAKSSSPFGIVHCAMCGRPCSGEEAYRYHVSRRACEHVNKVDRVGRDICPHCGCLFTSNAGLAYHIKSKVCGNYKEATEQAVVAELRARPQYSNGARHSAPAPAVGDGTPMRHKSSGQVLASVAKSGSASWVTPSPRTNTNSPAEDPYAKLSPRSRQKFQLEMQQAEEKYGGMMRDAMKLPEKEREEELTKLKNSFNSKQSITRKKYGIRLRERRSKQEIENERNRLLAAPSPKRPRLSSEGRASSAQANGTPVWPTDSAPGPAANIASLSSGLAAAPATAEHTDPTTLLEPSGPRSVAQAQPSPFKGTPDDPMQIDDSSTDTDDDIPARLPAHH